ncbi:MFS transporter [Streptomyces sp. NPDC086082]|uniref:MFS transporter n=1 Tax=Streptomyces sp. NPDC086082 TaxID=3365750 RepID=UPI0037F7416C
MPYDLPQPDHLAETDPPPAQQPALSLMNQAPGGRIAAPSGARRAALILAVLAVAQFLSALDVFIVNVALTPIGKGLHESSLSNLSWILNGYAIVYAALLVPAGRLADRFGRKEGFLLGLGLFTAASLGAAVSANLWVLVGFRLLQAAGAAAMTPSSLGLVLSSAPEGKTAAWVKIWSTSGALAAAGGPVIGGLLIQASWRWIFLVNLPVGLIALAVGMRVLPRVRHDISSRVPDLLGGAILVVAVAALSLGLVKAPDWGWGSPRTVLTLLVAAAGSVVFVLRTARANTPVIDLRLFHNRAFSAANVAALAFFAAFSMNLLALVLWIQGQFGHSPLKTGLLLAPGPALVVVGVLLGEAVAKRIPVGIVIATGAVLVAAAFTVFGLATSSAHFDYPVQILPAWLVGGVGVGLALPTIISSATQDLPAHQAATGSAVVNMASQIGSVVGVSVLVVLLATTGHPDPHHNFATAWFTAGALMLIAGLASLAIKHTPTADPAT